MMDLEVLSENEMPLLGRRQFVLKVTSLKQPTPSKQELSKAISTKLKVDENMVSLKRVSQEYGVNSCKVIVNVYNSPETMKKLEVYNKKPKKKTEAQ